jgi:NAD(P)-dependent dehydrogenase (short-subunit alcohol dehydrogenase family)
MSRNGRRDVVVITGASSGIARATAHMFSRQGARIALAARNKADLDDAARECVALGGEALVCVTDVTVPEEVERLAETVTRTWGRIDIWVNCAAVLMFGRFADQPLQAFRRVIETNLFGYVHGSRAALTAFERQEDRGTLINVTSMLGTVGEPYLSAYVASKHAIRGMTTCLRQEMRHKPGIRIVAILPVAIDSPIYQKAANFTGQEVRSIAPVYAADRVARSIVRAASRPRAEIIVGTYGYALDLANRISPTLLNWLVGLFGPKLQFTGQRMPASSGNLFESVPPQSTDGEWRRYWWAKLFGRGGQEKR